MKKLMNWMMISCRKAGELVERKLNHQISAVEKVELAFHTSFCNACRTYEKQSKEIEQAIIKSFNPSEKKAPENLKESLKKKFD